MIFIFVRMVAFSGVSGSKKVSTLRSQCLSEMCYASNRALVKPLVPCSFWTPYELYVGSNALAYMCRVHQSDLLFC